MKCAFVIFEGMTFMDFVGVYDALIRINTMGFNRTFAWDICALTKRVSDERGLFVEATKVGESLAGYDLLVIPGGYSVGQRMKEEPFLDWLRTFPYEKGVAASVCTGSLLLGTIGVLKDKRATSHRNALDALKPFCREVVDARVVDEGSVVTARGVTSSIFLGLHLCRRICGPEVARKIAVQMDWVET